MLRPVKVVGTLRVPLLCFGVRWLDAALVVLSLFCFVLVRRPPASAFQNKILTLIYFAF